MFSCLSASNRLDRAVAAVKSISQVYDYHSKFANKQTNRRTDKQTPSIT